MESTKKTQVNTGKAFHLHRSHRTHIIAASMADNTSKSNGKAHAAIYFNVLDPPEKDALLANLALQNHVPHWKVLIEISCMRSHEDLLATRRAYLCLYKRSLEEDLAFRTTGNIRKLLVAMASAYIYDGEEIDGNLAHLEAAILHDEILGKAVDHEETINVISTRSSVQLCAIFNRYKDIYGRSITKDLLSHPTNEYLSALRAAISCIKNPGWYYAKDLRNAINTVGTDEDALTRVIVTKKQLRKNSSMNFRSTWLSSTRR